MLPNPLPVPGSNEQGPMTVHVVWVNHRAFRLQWCQKCCFHRPPRTYHCPLCNICVEVRAPLACPVCPAPQPITWWGPGSLLIQGPVVAMKPLQGLLKPRGGSNAQPLLVTHAVTASVPVPAPVLGGWPWEVLTYTGPHTSILARSGQEKERYSCPTPPPTPHHRHPQAPTHACWQQTPRTFSLRLAQTLT